MDNNNNEQPTTTNESRGGSCTLLTGDENTLTFHDIYHVVVPKQTNAELVFGATIYEYKNNIPSTIQSSLQTTNKTIYAMVGAILDGSVAAKCGLQVFDILVQHRVVAGDKKKNNMNRNSCGHGSPMVPRYGCWQPMKYKRFRTLIKNATPRESLVFYVARIRVQPPNPPLLLSSTTTLTTTATNAAPTATTLSAAIVAENPTTSSGKNHFNHETAVIVPSVKRTNTSAGTSTSEKRTEQKLYGKTSNGLVCQLKQMDYCSSSMDTVRYSQDDPDAITMITSHKQATIHCSSSTEHVIVTEKTKDAAGTDANVSNNRTMTTITCPNVSQRTPTNHPVQSGSNTKSGQLHLLFDVDDDEDMLQSLSSRRRRPPDCSYSEGDNDVIGQLRRSGSQPPPSPITTNHNKRFKQCLDTSTTMDFDENSNNNAMHRTTRCGVLESPIRMQNNNVLADRRCQSKK